jgi:O-antigen biosynthesis protein
MSRRSTPPHLRLGKECERLIRRVRHWVRDTVAARRLVAASWRVNPTAVVARAAAAPVPDVILFAGDAAADAAESAPRVLAAWRAGLVPPARLWVAADETVGAACEPATVPITAAGVGSGGAAARPAGGPGAPFRPRRVTVREPGAAGGHAPLASLRAAVAQATTTHVVLADATALPDGDALAWLVSRLVEAPQVAAVYGDERAVAAEAGPRAGAATIHHQPDFSWVYLLSRNFLGPVVLFDRRRLLAAIDRLLSRDTVPRDTDAVLHAVALEALRRCGRDEVAHVAQPLSCRVRPVAAPATAVVGAALAAIGVSATVRPQSAGDDLNRIELRPSARQRVSIIIPTRNAATLVASCVRDLRSAAGYDDYDVTVIDHDSDEPALADFLEAEAAAGGVRRFPYHGPFNFAAMNNAAVAATSGSLLLFLNNDVDGFSPGWLGQMAATFELDPQIGAVGCLLLYPDGDIQHAGVVLNAKRMCQHAHYGWPGDARGYHGRIHALQEFSAVTAAVMMVRREAFAAVGGFDERFPDDYNDVDLCLRLGQAGYRIVYNPAVRATHWEGRTRRVKETGKEAFTARWRHAFSCDPWYHPHLAMVDFRPDGLERFWRERKLVALADAVLGRDDQPAARAAGARSRSA